MNNDDRFNLLISSQDLLVFCLGNLVENLDRIFTINSMLQHLIIY